MVLNHKALLQDGLLKLNLFLPDFAQERLLQFLDFLKKWNQAYNLTGIHELDKMITHHVLDSLTIAHYMDVNQYNHPILDVGSGGGFPGIPLAILFPSQPFILLDSQKKKTTFLIQAVAQFEINNVSVVTERVEKYRATQCFYHILSRAVGTLENMIRDTNHLICKNGRWLLMKGTYPYKELVTIHQPYWVHRLQVPGLDAKRHLVEIINEDRQ